MCVSDCGFKLKSASLEFGHKLTVLSYGMPMDCHVDTTLVFTTLQEHPDAAE